MESDFSDDQDGSTGDRFETVRRLAIEVLAGRGIAARITRWRRNQIEYDAVVGARWAQSHFARGAGMKADSLENRLFG